MRRGAPHLDLSFSGLGSGCRYIGAGRSGDVGHRVLAQLHRY